MRTIAFGMFPEDEVEDFVSACKKYGVKPSEFLIKAEEYLEETEVAPIRRDVLVYHPSGVAKRYRGGHVSSWTADFERDLESGFYAKKDKPRGTK